MMLIYSWMVLPIKLTIIIIIIIIIIQTNSHKITQVF